MPSRSLTTTTSSTPRPHVVVTDVVKSCFKDSPYLRCLFKFIKYLHNKDVAIDVVTYLHGIGAVVRTGRYDNSNRLVRLLKTIKPDDIVGWFNYLAYGTETPTENQKPTGCRANTLYSHKKKLSYYMIETAPHWNHQAQTGNPTKDKSVNDLLKKIKKAECRGTGKDSRTSEAFSRAEFQSVVTGSRLCIDNYTYAHSALITWQNTLIGRNDDMANIHPNEVMENVRPGFADTLTCKLHWSKNVVDENQVCPQIILGCMNTILCPLVSLATYISTLEESHFEKRTSLFGMNNGVSAKRLRKLIDMRLEGTNKRLATHSIRKHAATYCEQMGVAREVVNYRGRWRRIKAASNVYYSNDKPRKDCIAAIGTMGREGACRYRLNVPQGLTQCLLPASKFLNENVGLVLVKALVWACDNAATLVPNVVLQRLEEFRVQLGGSSNSNSMNLVAAREHVMLHPSMLELIAVDSGSSGDLHGVSVTLIQAQLTSIQAKLTQISHSHTSSLSAMTRAIAVNSRKVHSLVRNIDKVLYYRREDTFESSASDGGALNNILMPRIPTIGMLWQEFQSGIGSNKPAKLFTSYDRGKNRFVYSRRKVFWDLMVKLIEEGYSSTSALTNIDVVYGYGGASVSKLISRIRVDAKESYKNFYNRYPINGR